MEAKLSTKRVQVTRSARAFRPPASASKPSKRDLIRRNIKETRRWPQKRPNKPQKRPKEPEKRPKEPQKRPNKPETRPNKPQKGPKKASEETKKSLKRDLKALKRSLIDRSIIKETRSWTRHKNLGGESQMLAARTRNGPVEEDGCHEIVRRWATNHC